MLYHKIILNSQFSISPLGAGGFSILYIPSIRAMSEVFFGFHGSE